MSCRKETAIQGEIDAKKYNVKIALDLDRNFFGKGDKVSGNIRFSQSNELLSVKFNGASVKYNGISVDLGYGYNLFEFQEAKIGDKITVVVTYQDGKKIEEQFDIIVLESSKATDLIGESTKDLFEKWEARVGDGIAKPVKVNEEYQHQSPSDYLSERQLNIFPFAGLYGMTYVYFDESDKLNRIEIAHGKVGYDKFINLWEIYKDISEVYGDGEFSEDQMSFIIKSEGYLISSNQDGPFFKTIIEPQ